jgi:Farnesoic acid 0-methyl transferase
VQHKLVAASLFVIATLAALGCKARVPAIASPFADDFERAEPGPDWLDTSGGAYRIASGRLNATHAYNHPLWLRRKLPRDVVIEFDVMSKSPAGDIKVEIYGDGESFDPDKGRYDPTSYVIVLGGWNNSNSIIGRLGEHDDAVKASRVRAPGHPPPVEMGRTYHFTITRQGGTIDWKLDGAPFLAWTDPSPLFGPGHEFFAVDDWEADVHFDNLRIRPTN